MTITPLDTCGLIKLDGERYRKVRDRASYAFALVSVAAALEVQDGRVQNYLRIIGIAMTVLVLILIWGCRPS